ncbi:hypothetical protein, partial [Burkholderia humptydooensis]|uniref:hypothetical protein n=1 Tax=Burkholderia humptydooensis TaxID=430531 RepID=UPI001E3A9A12
CPEIEKRIVVDSGSARMLHGVDPRADAARSRFSPNCRGHRRARRLERRRACGPQFPDRQ